MLSTCTGITCRSAGEMRVSISRVGGMEALPYRTLYSIPFSNYLLFAFAGTYREEEEDPSR